MRCYCSVSLGIKQRPADFLRAGYFVIKSVGVSTVHDSTNGTGKTGILLLLETSVSDIIYDTVYIHPYAIIIKILFILVDACVIL